MRERAAERDQSYYKTQHAPTVVDKKRYANRPVELKWDPISFEREPLWKKQVAAFATKKSGRLGFAARDIMAQDKRTRTISENINRLDVASVYSGLYMCIVLTMCANKKLLAWGLDTYVKTESSA